MQQGFRTQYWKVSGLVPMLSGCICIKEWVPMLLIIYPDGKNEVWVSRTKIINDGIQSWYTQKLGKFLELEFSE